MKNRFEEAFKWIIKAEGGYVNDKDDIGGETKYGISKRAYPDLDIKNLTIEDAKKIYYNDYWLKIKGDDLNYPLNIIIFDTAVNLGVKRAIEFLQLTLKDMAADIVIDGIIGNQTIGHVHRLSFKLFEMIYRYVFHRCFYYSRLNVKFIKGWCNRVKNLLVYFNLEED